MMAPQAQEVWAGTEKQPFSFSWFQRESAPAPRTWWDRLRFRRPTMFIWTRRVVIFHVAKVQVDAFGGWLAILNTFLLPMIRTSADGFDPWGTQIEYDGNGPA